MKLRPRRLLPLYLLLLLQRWQQLISHKPSNRLCRPLLLLRLLQRPLSPLTCCGGGSRRL